MTKRRHTVPPSPGGREWRTIVEEARAFVPKHSAEWTDLNNADPSVVLAALFAFLAETLAYYQDLLADEAFLQTATTLGYRPQPPRPAMVELLVTARPGLVRTICLEPGLTVSSERSRAVFETVEPICLGRRCRVKAIERRTVRDECLGAGDASAHQRFRLKHRPLLLWCDGPDGRHVIDTLDAGAIDLRVRSAGRAQRWRPTSNLATAGPNTRVYLLDALSGSIRFGDGRNGRVPDKGATISASYRAGGGAKGNVPAHTLTRLPRAMAGIIHVTNPRPATGGADAETVEAFRKRVKHALRRRKRQTPTRT